MKLNFFKPPSPLFPFRWLVLAALLLTTVLVYANLTGWRLLSFSRQQEWSAKGPGAHK